MKEQLQLGERHQTVGLILCRKFRNTRLELQRVRDVFVPDSVMTFLKRRRQMPKRRPQ